MARTPRAAQHNAKDSFEQQIMARLDLARARAMAETAAHSVLSATEAQVTRLSLDGCLRLLHAMASEPNDKGRGDVRVARMRLYRQMDLPREFMSVERNEWRAARDALTRDKWLSQAAGRWGRNTAPAKRLQLMQQAVDRLWTAHGVAPPQLVVAEKGQPVRYDPGADAVSVPVGRNSLRHALNDMLLPLSEARAGQLAGNTPQVPRWPVRDQQIGGRLMLRYNRHEGAYIGPDYDRVAHANQPLSQYAALVIDTLRPALATRNMLGRKKLPPPPANRTRPLTPKF